MTDLAKLRALLEKIEPGLWEQDGFTVSYPCENGDSAFRMFKPEGAAMVAMMNEAPALLDEVEALQRANALMNIGMSVQAEQVEKLRAALREVVAASQTQLESHGKGIEPSQRLADAFNAARQALGSAK